MFAVLEETTPPEIEPCDLIEELEVVFTRRDRDEAQIVELIGRANSNKAFDRDGYSSMTALLKHRMSLHPGEAQRLIARANGLAGAPATAEAYGAGHISGAQVDILTAAKFLAPEAFSQAETRLVSLAMNTPLVTELRKEVDYWLDRVAADDLAARRDAARETRSLIIRRDGEMMRIAGFLDIESGERVRAQLDPGPPAQEDTRTTPARRADLLVDILNGASGRPEVIVHVSADSHVGGLSETGHGTFLTADEVQRIACDANLTRVVMGSDSQPLDVGRTKRLVTPALRTALTARDMGCVWPGCDRPPNWCDAHHLIPWSEGGPTSIDNLVLLCRHHHVLVHQAGWTIEGNPPGVTFFRPDGTELGSARPHRPWKAPFFSSEPPPPTPERIREIFEQVRRPRGP